MYTQQLAAEWETCAAAVECCATMATLKHFRIFVFVHILAILTVAKREYTMIIYHLTLPAGLG